MIPSRPNGVLTRHSCVGVHASGQHGRHHVQIGRGAFDQRVELSIPGLDCAELRHLKIQLRPGICTCTIEDQDSWAGRFSFACDGDVEQSSLFWRKSDFESGTIAGQRLRPRGELQERVSDNAIETGDSRALPPDR
jgi:hypothetical protein